MDRVLYMSTMCYFLHPFRYKLNTFKNRIKNNNAIALHSLKRLASFYFFFDFFSLHFHVFIISIVWRATWIYTIKNTVQFLKTMQMNEKSVNTTNRERKKMFFFRSNRFTSSFYCCKHHSLSLQVIFQPIVSQCGCMRLHDCSNGCRSMDLCCSIFHFYENHMTNLIVIKILN